MPGPSLGERPQWRIDRLVGQLERAEMHAEAPARADCEVRAQGFVGVHVHGLHEPARFVGANWNQGEVEGPQPRANGLERGAPPESPAK